MHTRSIGLIIRVIARHGCRSIDLRDLTEVHTTSTGPALITRRPARSDGIVYGDSPLGSRPTLSSSSMLSCNEEGSVGNVDCSDNSGTLIVVGWYGNVPISLSLLVLPLLTLGVCIQGSGIVGLLALLNCSEKGPPSFRDFGCPSYSSSFLGSGPSLSAQAVLANIALQRTR